MIIGRAGTRTVTCPEPMAKVYHAALTVALEALAKVPNSETTAMVLADLQAGFADIGEHPQRKAPAPAAPTLESRLGEIRSAAPSLPRGYQTKQVAGAWWIADAANGSEIMGPFGTEARAIEAFHDHESRPAE